MTLALPHSYVLTTTQWPAPLQPPNGIMELYKFRFIIIIIIIITAISHSDLAVPTSTRLSQ